MSRQSRRRARRKNNSLGIGLIRTIVLVVSVFAPPLAFAHNEAVKSKSSATQSSASAGSTGDINCADLKVGGPPRIVDNDGQSTTGVPAKYAISKTGDKKCHYGRYHRHVHIRRLSHPKNRVHSQQHVSERSTPNSRHKSENAYSEQIDFLLTCRQRTTDRKNCNSAQIDYVQHRSSPWEAQWRNAQTPSTPSTSTLS